MTDSFRYDAFGNVLSHQGTTSSVYGYDSQRFDAASGLYALRARSYDPTTGRFLSRDPATGNTTDPAQLDRYVYAAADPIMQSDPSGQSDLSEYAGQLMSAVIAVAGAAGIGLGGQVVLALGITLLYALLPEEVALPLVAWIGVGIIAGSVAYDTIQQELAIYSNLLSSVGASGGALGGGSETPSEPPSIGGSGGGAGATGGCTCDISPELQAAAYRVSAAQPAGWTRGVTVGRGMIEGTGNPPNLASPLFYGGQGLPHAEVQAENWVVSREPWLQSKGARTLTVTIITGNAPCGLYNSNPANCFGRFPGWAAKLRVDLIGTALTVAKVQLLYWPPNRSQSGRPLTWNCWAY